MSDIWAVGVAPASAGSAGAETVGPIKRLREDGSETASP